MASIFEHEHCTRCGGSGRYSYNHMHGDMCYGCQGRGVVFTKRGAAARQYFNESLTVPVADVVPGMRLLEHGRLEEVESIRPSEYNDGYTLVRFTNGNVVGMQDGSKVRRAAKDKVELESKRQAALDYQSTLTKAGKPRKR